MPDADSACKEIEDRSAPCSPANQVEQPRLFADAHSHNSSRTITDHPDAKRRLGFTTVELLIAAGILLVLAVISVPIARRAMRLAQRTDSMNNMRNFVLADTLYFADRNEFPKMDVIVPSSITRERLEIVATYCNLPLPEGPVVKWPKRKSQPRWINCPITRVSGYAEGLTVGGGLYTGYLYVGRVDESTMVASGLAALTNVEHNANRKNTHRGVLWASILGEFKTNDPRRFECFHYNTFRAYPDFRFHREELEGIHRGWSDGSAEWLPASSINLNSNSPDAQIKHALGNFYY